MITTMLLLKRNSMGPGSHLSSSVRETVASVQALGLVPWDELSPNTRERLETWTSVAKELWESEFAEHREALVRAWIWHYLDDNFFSFSGGGTPDCALIKVQFPSVGAFTRSPLGPGWYDFVNPVC